MSQLVPALTRNGFTLGKARDRRITTVLAMSLVTLAAVFVEGPRRMTTFGGSKVDVARLTVTKYALEAYPQWALAHPDRTCPVSLVELNAWMNTKDIRDPYGTDYQWSCGTYAGRTQLHVWSVGEDQLLGSADDIRSHE